jgi:Glycosyl transferase family 2
MQHSIVIPVHNEAQHLEAQISSFLRSIPPELTGVLREVILVENGSTDETRDVCYRLKQRYPDRIRVCVLSRGSYGEAIRKGMLESTGTHLSILECDVLDWSFVSRSIALFGEGFAQFIVGSKRHKDSMDRRPFKRRALTALYNLLLLRLCLGYPGTDTHGLKSIETECAKRLCQAAVTTDEVLQTEIVLLAWRMGMRIEEIPIQIREMRNTSVSIRRRLPKVLGTVEELKRSLRRFPASVSYVQTGRDGLPLIHDQTQPGR